MNLFSHYIIIHIKHGAPNVSKLEVAFLKTFCSLFISSRQDLYDDF